MLGELGSELAEHGEVLTVRIRTLCMGPVRRSGLSRFVFASPTINFPEWPFKRLG